MARRPEGYHLYRDNRSRIFQVRFTFKAKRHSVSTGERDPDTAGSEAARIYAEVVLGRSPGQGAVVQGEGRPFLEVAAMWLAEAEPFLDEDTFDLYANIYVGGHFARFFRTIGELTTAGAREYIGARLGQVRRETVKKEIPVLRQLGVWAHENNFLAEAPVIKTPGRRVVGNVQKPSRKRVFLVFSKAEVEAIIARLPEYATNRRTGERFAVRARFVLAWVYALRPETLNKLSVGEHYWPGAADITITEDIDKNRFARELMVTAEARHALDSICPAGGIIFGEHDYRNLLRAAARAVGIDEYRAARLSDYDFRHSRLTYLGRITNNLIGLMYIAGHKQPATTAKYLHPPKEAADHVLIAASAAPTSGTADPEKAAAEAILIAA